MGKSWGFFLDILTSGGGDLECPVLGDFEGQNKLGDVKHLDIYQSLINQHIHTYIRI